MLRSCTDTQRSCPRSVPRGVITLSGDLRMRSENQLQALPSWDHGGDVSFRKLERNVSELL